MSYRFPHNNLDPYEDRVSTELNKCLRHHTGREMDNLRLGLKCDDTGWVAIEDVLKYERIWCHDEQQPHMFVINRGYRGQPDTWNKEEAGFRMSVLMKVTFYCARWGRRVREEILAFGVTKDMDRSCQVCIDNGLDDQSAIPEDGLLLYPVAVRAPAGQWSESSKGSHPLRCISVASTFRKHCGAVARLLPRHAKGQSGQNPNGRPRARQQWHPESNADVFQSLRSMGSKSMEDYEKRQHSPRRLRGLVYPNGDALHNDQRSVDGLWTSGD